jgi:hypothetical protein
LIQIVVKILNLSNREIVVASQQQLFHDFTSLGEVAGDDMRFGVLVYAMDNNLQMLNDWREYITLIPIQHTFDPDTFEEDFKLVPAAVNLCSERMDA